MTIDIDPAKLNKLANRTGLDQDNLGSALARYADARTSAEAWMGLDAPHLPPGAIDAVQVRLVRWQTRNFGTPKAVEIAAGITEECGERQLALEQLDLAGIEDAIGDVMVYSSQLATARRLNFERAIEAGGWNGLKFFPKLSIQPQAQIAIACGYLSHVQLKEAQGIRDMVTVDLCRFGTFVGLAMLMQGILRGSSREPTSIFVEVAERVMKRDWIADKSTGGEA